MEGSTFIMLVSSKTLKNYDDEILATIYSWISIWSSTIETKPEFEVSLRLFLNCLQANKASLGSTFILQMEFFLKNSLLPYEDKWLFRYRQRLPAEDQKATLPIEAGNSTIEICTVAPVIHNMGIDWSINNQLEQLEYKSAWREL